VLIGDVLPSWRRFLLAHNRAETTIAAYLADVELLRAYLGDLELADIRRRHIAEWLADQIEKNISPATVGRRFRSAQQFFRWAVDEGEIVDNPMAKLKAPRVPDQPPKFPTDDEVAALREVCSKRRQDPSRKFEGTRDLAVIDVLAATGVRASELTGMTVADVDLDEQLAWVTGKGGRRRVVGLGPDLTATLDRYDRMRRTHRHRDLDAFWLSERGALTYSGLSQLLRRRCAEAGIDRISAHAFRHRFAHKAKLAHVSDENLQTLAGWSSNQMVARYGRSAAAARALEAHRALQRDGNL